MKKQNFFFTVLILFLSVLPNGYSQSNEIEKKFIDAGLVDVTTLDRSIQADLVNSNPKKNYFRENSIKA
jgi:D-alanyl-D-alanine dipeptidase